jgi:hypothetical protein
MAEERPKRRRSARSPEAAERQCIMSAYELAQHQLDEGTASPSVITHYLKLASGRERLEREKLERENEVLRAKAEAYESNKKTEELYEQAIQAMKTYSGYDTVDEDVSFEFLD